MIRRQDGVLASGLETADPALEACDWCHGHHDKVCRDEHEFARAVKAADARLWGVKSWSKAQRSIPGPGAANYRDRGRQMAHKRATGA